MKTLHPALVPYDTVNLLLLEEEFYLADLKSFTEVCKLARKSEIEVPFSGDFKENFALPITEKMAKLPQGTYDIHMSIDVLYHPRKNHLVYSADFVVMMQRKSGILERIFNDHFSQTFKLPA